LSAAAAVLVATVAGIGLWRSAAVKAKAPVNAKAPAETVTTASADSLRLYYRSEEVGHSGDFNSALALVQQAIAADPTFALAHTWKAWCLLNTDAAPEDVVAEAKRAVDMSSGASEWERLWIDASYDCFTDNIDKEIAALTALVKLRPDHFFAVFNLAQRLNTVGRDRDAVPYAVQAVKLRPTGPAIALAARILVTAGETDRALEYAHRARVMVDQQGYFGLAYNAWLAPIEALWRRGDVRGASAALDAARTDCAQLKADYRVNFAQYLVSANLSLGRWRAARDAADVMPDPNARHFNRAIVAFHADDHGAWEHEMNLVSSGGFGARERSFYLLKAGKVDVAEWEVDHAAIGMDRGGLQVARARIALARGERGQAVALLQSAQPSPRVMDSVARFEDLATLYLAQGDRPRAIQALQESLNYRSIPFLSMWWMRNELRLAELYHEAGRDADAQPLEAELDKLLVAADPDFPLLARLRALEAKTPTSVAFRPRD
jgi:tetratricopeptide (TPR) repeat protein